VGGRGGGGGRWRKHGGRNWSRALLNTVSAQHDFFGADTRLGVCRMHARARARAHVHARSPRHYVKLNKHKSNERASERQASEPLHTSTAAIAPHANESEYRVLVGRGRIQRSHARTSRIDVSFNTGRNSGSIPPILVTK